MTPHRFLFGNHDEIKPIELAAVPLNITTRELKRRLRAHAHWPVGLGNSSTAPGTAPSTPIPTQKAAAAAAAATADEPSSLLRRRRPRPAEPQTAATAVSIDSPPPPPSALDEGEGSKEGTDDELEDEDAEEDGAAVTVTTPPVLIFSPSAVDPARIRLFCLGRGLDDEGKRLKDMPIPVFDDHPTPVQVAIRPAAATPVAARRKTLEGGEAHGVGGGRVEEGEEVMGSLGACCGCSVM